ncbi:hypothetical protein BP6252_02101 [Coleophoma cylindrospora]|uniref:Malic acid transport protein n=1 Tax=Coleophoma cylindrospora TaxID=1849047 RepID=A0A3D8SEA6_9HELO|nr:hypothetical protein BP6252_02101 [Coleophoma cylindrospora]
MIVANGNVKTVDDPEQSENVGWRVRMHHFTWAWYTLTMSTGGIALVIAQTPHRFQGLTTIGIIFFILDLVMFATVTLALAARFILFPASLRVSLRHPVESLFVPCFLLSIATTLSNIQSYGVPHAGVWLTDILRVLFWIYCAVTFLVSVGQYYLLFTGKPMTLQSMTPVWILPIFPVMLAGTVASAISRSQSPEHALPIMIAGLTFQGLGFFVSCFMYANYVGRLMTAGLPSPNTRPGMFIAVGPPSFTGLALVGISSSAYRVFPSYTSISLVEHPSWIADILRVGALGSAILLWTLAFWFFCISLVSVLGGLKTMTFHLSWWSFVFPNVGFTIALIEIGDALNSPGILWVTSVMTVLLVITWLMVICCQVQSILNRQILWPGKDEDRND